MKMLSNWISLFF